MSPEVWAAVVTGCFTLMVTVLAIALPRLLAQGRDIAEVKDQVKNSHGTNLRDDLDALRLEMRHGFAQVHERFHRLENPDA